MALFEVAIVEKAIVSPSGETIKSERLVFGPKAVCATNTAAASTVALADGKMLPDTDLNRIEVLVRPFK